MNADLENVGSCTLHLPDHALEDATPYARWLSSGSNEIDYEYDPRIQTCMDDYNHVPKLYKCLIEMYLYSQKIKDEAYGRAVLLGMIETQIGYGYIPPVELLRMLYDVTAPGCLTRRLLSRFVVY